MLLPSFSPLLSLPPFFPSLTSPPSLPHLVQLPPLLCSGGKPAPERLVPATWREATAESALPLRDGIHSLSLYTAKGSGCETTDKPQAYHSHSLTANTKQSTPLCEDPGQVGCDAVESVVRYPLLPKHSKSPGSKKALGMTFIHTTSNPNGFLKPPVSYLILTSPTPSCCTLTSQSGVQLDSVALRAHREGRGG